ncbi:2',3'-cyclic-nucleotide 3'-phosphodiesterase [Oryzias melastigma]|uniref:2',3'-cyclic-nucleotide 3'-phosphodiesterase n=1 Tax=Oryzias melastigma TaxID=30732 RepID=A0A834FNX5_ORYME|nr:2',3'-cyclic-nucleotide 3'-phosphodiesterase [Oryzias melastigma]
MKVPLEEVALPLYFGWFLLPAVQEKIRCTSMDFLKTLDTLEAFKKHLIDFTGKPDQEGGPGAVLQVHGDVALHHTVLQLWKSGGFQRVRTKSSSSECLWVGVRAVPDRSLRHPSHRGGQSQPHRGAAPPVASRRREGGGVCRPRGCLPAQGSRAHVTLGCAEGVEPVQTGFDLLQILALQKDGQQGEPLEMELGSLIYYSEGRWMLTLREPISVPACFSSFYAQKEQEPPKKEPEKKKQKKCSIL